MLVNQGGDLLDLFVKSSSPQAMAAFPGIAPGGLPFLLVSSSMWHLVTNAQQVVRLNSLFVSLYSQMICWYEHRGSVRLI